MVQVLELKMVDSISFLFFFYFYFYLFCFELRVSVMSHAIAGEEIAQWKSPLFMYIMPTSNLLKVMGLIP